MTLVFNMTTSERRSYGLSPEEAVVAAYKQEHGDYNTWEKGKTPPITYGNFTLACGEWCAFRPSEEIRKGGQ